MNLGWARKGSGGRMDVKLGDGGWIDDKELVAQSPAHYAAAHGPVTHSEYTEACASHPEGHSHSTKGKQWEVRV